MFDTNNMPMPQDKILLFFGDIKWWGQNHPRQKDMFPLYMMSLHCTLSLSVQLLSALRPPRFSEKIAEGQMKALAASLRYQLRQIFPRMSPIARRMFTCGSPPTLGLALPLSSTSFASAPQTHTQIHRRTQRACIGEITFTHFWFNCL